MMEYAEQIMEYYSYKTPEEAVEAHKIFIKVINNYLEKNPDSEIRRSCEKLKENARLDIIVLEQYIMLKK